MNSTSGYLRVGAQQGWQCPLCGKIYGPFVQECYHCNNQSVSVTTTYSGTTTGESQNYTITYPAEQIGKHSVIQSEKVGKHSKRKYIKGGN